MPLHPSLDSAQLIKLTQKKCNSRLPNTKSANALSCEMLSKLALFSGLVWMRSDAVSTNWPTQALKPERKALKGCSRVSSCNARASMAPPASALAVWRETHEVANEHNVEELQSADDDKEQHEAVEQLGSVWCLLNVALPYALQDVLRVVGGLGFRGRVRCAGDGLGSGSALLGRHCGFW